MQAPLLSASALGKRFDHRQVLRDVSFEIAAGEFLLLLGNNGAGKSTLLKLLCSLHRPSSGALYFLGSPTPSTAQRAAVGMISHESRFYGDLSAWENLNLYGILYNVSQLRRRLPAVLEEVGLASYPELPLRSFSSGMVKRLALARLALLQPRLLLLDEPYSGLDQNSVRLLDAYLARFKASGGSAVLVTHQLARGAVHGERVLILHEGQLVYDQKTPHLNGAACAALLEAHTQQTSLEVKNS